ncbi:PIN domain-containing protein [archaeon]|nr:PIN domain-containing protein [archaeon]
MLLDTYAWVEFFNGTQKGEIVKGLLKKNVCFTSAISLAELSEWIERKKLNRKNILKNVKIIYNNILKCTYIYG